MSVFLSITGQSNLASRLISIFHCLNGTKLHKTQPYSEYHECYQSASQSVPALGNTSRAMRGYEVDSLVIFFSFQDLVMFTTCLFNASKARCDRVTLGGCVSGMVMVDCCTGRSSQDDAPTANLLARVYGGGSFHLLFIHTYFNKFVFSLCLVLLLFLLYIWCYVLPHWCDYFQVRILKTQVLYHHCYNFRLSSTSSHCFILMTSY